MINVSLSYNSLISFNSSGLRINPSPTCMYVQFGNSNRQQRPNLVLNRSLTCVKSAAISLYVAKLLAATHFDLDDNVCVMYVHFFLGVKQVKVPKKPL